MTPQIVKVDAMPGYKLCLRFRTGETKLFDVGPYLNQGVFKELRNESYFKKVRIISGGIDWPHEQDLSADTLYYRGVSLRKPEKAPNSRKPARSAE